jgi:hypothetical protein
MKGPITKVFKEPLKSSPRRHKKTTAKHFVLAQWRERQV